MRRAAAIAMLVCLPMSAAIADVYRSVDAQGKVVYSDTPTAGSELVHVQNLHAQINPTAASPSANRAAANGTTAAAASAAGAGSAPKSTDPVHDQLAQQAAQQAVDRDLAATRAEQCTKATADYNSSVEARRIYRNGPDGEREYLTDAQADEQRLNLRLAMETACNTQSQ
ncbi:MAG: DUF4124 domain-containing protein [Steroidobacteraceae bacterium]|jgi:hypothetical protein